MVRVKVESREQLESVVAQRKGEEDREEVVEEFFNNCLSEFGLSILGIPFHNPWHYEPGTYIWIQIGKKPREGVRIANVTDSPDYQIKLYEKYRKYAEPIRQCVEQCNLRFKTKAALFV